MIRLTLGPMFGGKSTELKRLCERHRHAQRKVIAIKYAGDNRYTTESKIMTHDGQSIPAISCKWLSESAINPADVDVIAIDEIQFYQDNIEFCEKMANAGVIIEAVGLGGNYKRDTFNRMGEFIGKADDINFVKAICKRCFQDASFTARISDEDGEEVIGGAEKYIPVCRKCYLEL